MLLGETFGAFADQINVRTLIQYFARHPNWIADVLHTSHPAGTQSSAVHHESVELYAAIAI